MAGGLLGSAPGYLVEGGEGLVLAAFGSPAAAVGWALECMEAMRQEEWEPELLAHELCEEVISFGANGGLVEPAIRQGSGRHATLPPPLPSRHTTGDGRQGGASGSGSSGPGDAAALAASARPVLAVSRSYALQRQGSALYRGLRIKVKPLFAIMRCPRCITFGYCLPLRLLPGLPSVAPALQLHAYALLSTCAAVPTHRWALMLASRRTA